MVGGIQLSTPGLTAAQSAQLHDQNTDTGTTQSSFQIKKDDSGPKLVEKNNGLEIQKADGTVLAFVNADGEIQIGGATGSKLVNDSGIVVTKADDTEIFRILEDDDGSLRLGGATGYRLKVVAGSGWIAVRDDDDSHYCSLAVAYMHSHNGLLGNNLRPVESAADLSLQLRNNSYRVKCNDSANLEIASFAPDDFQQLKQGDCGIHRKIAVSAETSLSGASTTVSNVAPQAAKIIGSGVIVSEAITSGDGATSFDIAYNAGAASQSIATGQAFAKNTKTQKFFDANANADIASAQVDHVITPDSGTFSGGKVFTFCIYEELVAFDDIA